MRGSTLFGVRFDPAALAPVGEAEPLLDHVRMDPLFGYGGFSVARDGTLVYLPGDARPVGRTLLWVTPLGAETPAFSEERPFLMPAVSPDGRSFAVTIEGVHQDLWRVDAGRPVLVRLTSSPGEDFGPVWSSDGRAIAFTSIREGHRPQAFVKPADTPDGERRLADVDLLFPNAWLRAGGGVLATQQERSTSGERNLLVTVNDQGEIRPAAESRFDRYTGTIAPGGERVAFVSLETGRPEVFVASWPGAVDARQASVGGGTSPVWARNGLSLFYRNGDGVYAVDVGQSAGRQLAAPRLLFRGRFQEPGRPDWPRNYDVAPDGRFLMIRETYTPVLNEAIVVLNWHGEPLPRSASR
jgi:hypothetical protein